MKKQFNRILIFPIAAACVLLLLGISMLFWPTAIISVFPPLIGIILIFVGVLNIAHSMVLHQLMLDPGFKLMQGIITLIVGLVFILKQDISMAFLTILFGLYVLISAAIHFSSALEYRREKKKWLSALFESLFQFLLGALLLFGTFSDNALWARLLGLEFIVMGTSTLVLLLRMKDLGDDAFQ